MLTNGRAELTNRFKGLNSPVFLTNDKELVRPNLLLFSLVAIHPETGTVLLNQGDGAEATAGQMSHHAPLEGLHYLT